MRALVRLTSIPFILLWIFLFAYGITTPSHQLMGGARSSNDVFTGDKLQWILASTLTNTAMLCLLMGYVGVVYRKIPAGMTTAAYVRTLTNGVLRGFYVYLLFVSGSWVVNENPVDTLLFASQQQYVKAAATVSLLSFMVAWKPELISKLTQPGQLQGDDP